MPEFDAYCALCGACAAIPYYPDDDEKGHYYDPKVITRDDMQWMDDLRVIGFNPESRSRSKYVSYA